MATATEAGPVSSGSGLRKKVIPAALVAALTSPLAYVTLERLEGNVLRVYADKLAGGIPTYCAGRTDWKAKVGTRLTNDECRDVNKATLIEFGYAVLGCTDWNQLTPGRLIGLTMFAINVGKQGACSSSAVRYINAGRVGEGCNLLAYKPDGAPNWSYAQGVYVKGLHNRRLAERDLCLDRMPA